MTVERPATPGALVRVRTSDGLLAARLVARNGTHAEVALVARGALLLGGDHAVLGVRVEAGCALTLTDVGGTVAYDGEGRPCRWDTDLRLGAGASLDWAGLPFVVAAGADVRRTTTARLGAGARLTLRETVVLGRAGERGGDLVLRTEAADDAGPLLVEELRASGERPVPGVLGDHPVIDTVTTLHGSPGDEGSAGHDLTGRHSAGDATAGHGPRLGDAVVLRLERGGTLTRWLGPATHLSPLDPPRPAGP
ncbi:urease accessory protein UreD [Myceligenerans indicum]|uniref:Urease accessory protein UreD n=1 Tax=Myceligenerans indicum TaxID=2593663 RepID=A0ABS1LK30_9MICO|nr:urease accessory protein UreD [Myceligenerans indicum]MBL0886538.1 urease accessory protein UreD [Myceligenerans indicum]